MKDRKIEKIMRESEKKEKERKKEAPWVHAKRGEVNIKRTLDEPVTASRQRLRS